MKKLLTNNNPQLQKIIEEDKKIRGEFPYQIKNTENVYKLIIKIFSEYMKIFFNITSKSQFVCEIDYNVPYGKGYDQKYDLNQKIKISIFKIFLKLKEEDIPFVLFYGKYNYKNCIKKQDGKFYELEEEAKSYKIILNLLKADNHITKYGIYDHFINSGIYVYKIFEYNQQISYHKNQISSDYTFIGDLLTNMWPLNDISE